ncbi:hypothetical protein EV421DRAFT_1908337 [Armillaria borealis]|uniref:DUF6570 domain-containing protein n=1 Tax=Armillaria borealis TaxID=47425 RepID=A0AA39MIR1_9AGAR|nr:hypothetical protein EV421DRAFT_1908337 [Armillaria borealis]
MSIALSCILVLFVIMLVRCSAFCVKPFSIDSEGLAVIHGPYLNISMYHWEFRLYPDVSASRVTHAVVHSSSFLVHHSAVPTIGSTSRLDDPILEGCFGLHLWGTLVESQPLIYVPHICIGLFIAPSSFARNMGTEVQGYLHAEKMGALPMSKYYVPFVTLKMYASSLGAFALKFSAYFACILSLVQSSMYMGVTVMLICLICLLLRWVCLYLNVVLSIDTFVESLECSELGSAVCDPHEGGSGTQYIDHATVSRWLLPSDGPSETLQNTYRYSFVDHQVNEVSLKEPLPDNHIRTTAPLSVLCEYIPLRTLKSLAKIHVTNVKGMSYMNKAAMVSLFKDHDCEHCSTSVSILKRHIIFGAEAKLPKQPAVGLGSLRDPISLAFPPVPLDDKLAHSIISDFCAASSPEAFKEAGCAVCGQLTPLKKLSNLRHMRRFLHILENPVATRKYRSHETDPVTYLDGPVLDNSCDLICLTCRASVRKGVVPPNALCNGLWLGEIPKELKELSFVERLLVARI